MAAANSVIGVFPKPVRCPGRLGRGGDSGRHRQQRKIELLQVLGHLRQEALAGPPGQRRLPGSAMGQVMTVAGDDSANRRSRSASTRSIWREVMSLLWSVQSAPGMPATDQAGSGLRHTIVHMTSAVRSALGATPSRFAARATVISGSRSGARREDVQDQPAAGGRGIDRLSQRSQPDLPRLERLHRLDELLERARRSTSFQVTSVSPDPIYPSAAQS